MSYAACRSAGTEIRTLDPYRPLRRFDTSYLSLGRNGCSDYEYCDPDVYAHGLSMSSDGLVVVSTSYQTVRALRDPAVRTIKLAVPPGPNWLCRGRMRARGRHRGEQPMACGASGTPVWGGAGVHACEGDAHVCGRSSRALSGN
jgi:hypothetical protein